MKRDALTIFIENRNAAENGGQAAAAATDGQHQTGDVEGVYPHGRMPINKEDG